MNKMISLLIAVGGAQVASGCSLINEMVLPPGCQIECLRFGPDGATLLADHDNEKAYVANSVYFIKLFKEGASEAAATNGLSAAEYREQSVSGQRPAEPGEPGGKGKSDESKVTAQPLALPKTNTGTTASLMMVGFGYVEARCEDYFVAVRRYQQANRALSQEFSLVGTAATGVMAALSAAAKAIEIVSFGMSFGAATTENYGRLALFDQASDEIRLLVKRAQITYREEVSSKIINDEMQAMEIVRAYARICLPSNIEMMVKQAIGKATTSSSDDATEKFNGEFDDNIRRYIAAHIKAKGDVSIEQLTFLYRVVVSGENLGLDGDVAKKLFTEDQLKALASWKKKPDSGEWLELKVYLRQLASVTDLAGQAKKEQDRPVVTAPDETAPAVSSAGAKEAPATPSQGQSQQPMVVPPFVTVQ